MVLCYIFLIFFGMIRDCIVCDIHINEIYEAFLLPVHEQEIFAHLYTTVCFAGHVA